MTALTKALAAFGKAGYAVLVFEQNPDTSPGELKVEVWNVLLYRTGGPSFHKAKTQEDGDVLAALRFIRERWMHEVDLE